MIRCNNIYICIYAYDHDDAEMSSSQLALGIHFFEIYIQVKHTLCELESYLLVMLGRCVYSNCVSNGRLVTVNKLFMLIYDRWVGTQHTYSLYVNIIRRQLFVSIIIFFALKI